MGAFVSFPLFPWQDFAIYHNEFAVELFVGAFPAVVAPEVEAWVAADGLFEELEEANVSPHIRGGPAGCV